MTTRTLNTLAISQIRQYLNLKERLSYGLVFLEEEPAVAVLKALVVAMPDKQYECSTDISEVGDEYVELEQILAHLHIWKNEELLAARVGKMLKNLADKEFLTVKEEGNNILYMAADDAISLLLGRQCFEDYWSIKTIKTEGNTMLFRQGSLRGCVEAAA